MRILRLPPYHCFLNAIEKNWSVLKEGARKKGLRLTKRTVDAVIGVLHEQHDEILNDEVINMCDHVRTLQEQWLERDLEASQDGVENTDTDQGAARTDVDIGSVNSPAQDDDDEDFDAMCEELLEDLRIEPDDETSDSSSDEDEDD